jgi:pimeloyl-ACP methyl ester carboxylesterase
MLAGGPGQAGYVFGKIVKDIAARMPDADIFVPDHRGTGYSHRLTCPQQDQPNTYGGYSLDPKKGKACLDALKQNGDYDKLPFFTAVQAAGDVVQGIEAARTSPDEKVYVWGGSYGTHLAHHVLQLAPSTSGFVFDGFITPGKFYFVDYDKGAERQGTDLAAECDLNPSCSTHLGGPALAKIKTVLSGLDGKPCAGFNRDAARTWMTVLADGWGSRGMVFPMIHRLERCSADDQTALTFLINNYSALLTKAYAAVPFVNSGILQNNIVLSEMWAPAGAPPSTKAELNAAADAQTFLAGQSLAGSLIDLRAIWPLPKDDYSSLPTPVMGDAKLLWLGAALDQHTSRAQGDLIGQVYPSAPYILIPDAAHVPSGQSPMKSDPKDQCGLHIVTAFIEGDGAVDISCEKDLLAPFFEAPNGAWALKYWNTADDWGDGAPKPVPPKAKGAPSLELNLDLDLDLTSPNVAHKLAAIAALNGQGK